MPFDYLTADREALIAHTLSDVEAKAPSLILEWAARYLETRDTDTLREWFAMDDPDAPQFLPEDYTV